MLLISALETVAAADATSEAPADAATAIEDPCLLAVRAGAADADRVCSDWIAGLRYEGSTGRSNTALPGALNNRATARMQAGDLEGAAADLTEALEMAPTAWALYLNRANLSLMNGDAAAALNDLGRVRELVPDASAAALAAKRAADRNSVLAWRMLGNLDAARTQLATVQAQELPTDRQDRHELRSEHPAPEAPGRPPG